MNYQDDQLVGGYLLLVSTPLTLYFLSKFRRGNKNKNKERGETRIDIAKREEIDRLHLERLRDHYDNTWGPQSSAEADRYNDRAIQLQEWHNQAIATVKEMWGLRRKDAVDLVNKLKRQPIMYHTEEDYLRAVVEECLEMRGKELLK